MLSAYQQVESEGAASYEEKLDVINSLETKSYLTDKIKQFLAGCIKSFSKWASYAMDIVILGSVSGLSLEFSDNKLPHYQKEMKMRFSSKKELFLAYEI